MSKIVIITARGGSKRIPSMGNIMLYEVPAI